MFPCVHAQLNSPCPYTVRMLIIDGNTQSIIQLFLILPSIMSIGNHLSRKLKCQTYIYYEFHFKDNFAIDNWKI